MFADLLTSDIRLTYGTIATQDTLQIISHSHATKCLLCDSIKKINYYIFAFIHVSEDILYILNKDIYHFIYLYL